MQQLKNLTKKDFKLVWWQYLPILSVTGRKPANNGYASLIAIHRENWLSCLYLITYEKKMHQQNRQEESVFSTCLSILLLSSVTSTDKYSLLQFPYHSDNSKAGPQGPARLFVMGFWSCSQTLISLSEQFQQVCMAQIKHVAWWILYAVQGENRFLTQHVPLMWG